MATAALDVDIGTLITRTPGVNGGRPCMAGTGTSVLQISCEYNDGRSAEEILRRRPYLDLARIHAAIAYYLANKAKIDAELEEEQQLYLRMMAESEGGPKSVRKD